jgi:hypothetical protein
LGIASVEFQEPPLLELHRPGTTSIILEVSYSTHVNHNGFTQLVWRPGPGLQVYVSTTTGYFDRILTSAVSSSYRCLL